MNLFAYTGGSTLAAAAAGAAVVHVDAARNTVGRARRNAELSGFQHHPIRWMVEDATRFCRREVKRGQRYDALIIDPPTYGHGPRKEPWHIGQHLATLLDICTRLISERFQFLLLTSHSERFDEKVMAELVRTHLGSVVALDLDAGAMRLATTTGRLLPSGCYVRGVRAE